MLTSGMSAALNAQIVVWCTMGYKEKGILHPLKQDFNLKIRNIALPLINKDILDEYHPCSLKKH